jgi:hypothetical protein
MSDELIAFPSAAGFTDADLAVLRQAKLALEQPGLAIRLASYLGTPFDKMLRRLPSAARERIDKVAHSALSRCLDTALKTLPSRRDSLVPYDTEPSLRPPRNMLHKLAVATTGAAGGAFGLAALPVELPVTTTLMFRSICDIARSNGEDLGDPAAQLQCLLVFAMGGPTATDDSGELGYFIARGALAQAVSNAATELGAQGAKTAFTHGSTAVLRLINAVATRFSTQVTEQIAAKSVPVLGAALGAVINTMFIEHYQAMAHGHFTIRRLERKYGQDLVHDRYMLL